MTDIAKIGVSFDTNELKAGAAAIRAVVPVAKDAENAASKLEDALSGVSNAADKAALGSGKVGNAMASVAAGANSSSSAVNKATGSTVRASSAASEMAEAINRESAALNAAAGAAVKQSGAIDKATGSVKAHTAATVANSAAAGKSNVNLNGFAKALEAASGSLKLTARDTLNLSRQFADVGVTAAMGMNPLMIAIQQGPQLLDIFQEKAIQTGNTIGTVFRAAAAQVWAMIAPFVAMAAIIGAVVVVLGALTLGWLAGEKSAMQYERAVTGVGRTANLTADELRNLSVSAAEQGNVSIKSANAQATAYLATGRIGGEVISGLIAISKDYASFIGADMETATGKLADAFKDPEKAAVDLTREFGLLTQEQIKQVKAATAAGDQLKAQKILLEGMQGAVSGHAENVGMITSAWDAVGIAISNAITKFGEWMYVTQTEEITQRENALKSPFVLPGARRQREQELTELRFQQGYDNARRENAARNGAANQAAQLRVDNAAKAKKPRSGGKTDAEKFEDIVTGADADIASVRAKIAGVDLTAAAAARLTNEQKLLNDAERKGIELTAAQRGELVTLAGTLSDLQVQFANLEGFKKITEGADRTLAALTAEGEMIGVYGEKLMIARYEQDMLDQAKSKDIELTEAQIAKIHELAVALGAAQAVNERRTFMEGMMKGVDERIAQLEAERNSLGFNADETARLRIENELLAQARQKNIELTPAEIAMIGQVATETANLENGIRKTREALDFAKGATRGFLGDMMSGLQQGQSAWETFGNAVVNILNKIIDKMLDAAVEGLFSGGKGGKSGGGGGGWFGKIAGAIMGGFTGGSGVASAAGAGLGGSAPLQFAAKGAILNGPTAFSHAAGVTIGGEAGQEALVPLKRGADGSLGVQMHGGKGGGTTISAPVTIEQTFVLSGAISSADVQQMTKKAAEESEQTVKRSFSSWLTQMQNDGAIV